MQQIIHEHLLLRSSNVQRVQLLLHVFTAFCLREEECHLHPPSSIKEVIQQYLLEFPGGAKCSYIYGHIPKNFCSNTMLAGLCNLCEDYGHFNFASLKDFVQKVGADYQRQDLSVIVQNIKFFNNTLRQSFHMRYKHLYIVTCNVPVLCY